MTKNYAGKDGKFSEKEARKLVESVQAGKKNRVDVFVIKDFKIKERGGYHPAWCLWKTCFWKDRGDGVLVKLMKDKDEDWQEFGQIIAHELGHFFGLKHRGRGNNLMYPRGGVIRTQLTGWQRGHLVDNIKRYNKSGEADDIEEE